MTANTKRRKQTVLAVAIIILVVAIDQIIKLLVKTNMSLHESIRITDWFYLVFIENNGAAFGMEVIGKLFLTIFRIVAVTVASYYLAKLIKKGSFGMGYIATISLVIAGAAGNIFDCVFYGKMFGYADLFMGKVVDMFYFPLIETTWPSWMPMVGGEHFVFFSPVFNFADSAITCGVIILLIWFRKELSSLSSSVR